ncbi:hypothetical protein LX36DRAFT_657155 [Colletotrichum falcatum]|nr:hypothetical protein LX36DRAFT_657155 [Colletotrichum falcatum]
MYSEIAKSESCLHLNLGTIHRARGERLMTAMLPKKQTPPDFKRQMGMRGRGIYAQMGFSVKKILWRLIVCVISMLISAVVWLVCINSTDLQNTSVPAMIVLALFTIVLAQVPG